MFPSSEVRPLRLIGLDPGLRHTGWGVIDVAGNRLSHVADGAVHSDGDLSLAERLTQLHDALTIVIERHRPDEAAVEEVFVNKNPASTLKLGMARGVALLVPARAGLPVAEYPTNLVKKSVVGAGHADKKQVQVMVRMLLPGAELASADAADALAVAICHAHHMQTKRMWVSGFVAGLTPALSPSPPRGEGRGEGAGAGLLRPAELPPHDPPSPGALTRATLSPGGRGLEGALLETKLHVKPVTEDAERPPTETEVTRARSLRREQTDVEAKLWRYLRGKNTGAKFRRQEPILGFIVDFVCHEHRLIIELDGGQHADQTTYDERRSQRLTQAGFRVLRFWNTELTENFDGVAEAIAAALPECRP
jgi:crossover junction endodeoxyribonuclease RuvC